jgi:AraC family transcriptional regulator of adaptative response / DNA-3-methyladenine glycosylase II
LLEAALDLFVEKGYAATRVEEVAARAGVWRPWRAYGALHLALAGISGNQLMESDDAQRAA